MFHILKVALILVAVSLAAGILATVLSLLFVSIGTGELAIQIPSDSPLAKIPWGLILGLAGAAVVLFFLSRFLNLSFSLPGCPVGCLLVLILVGGGLAAVFLAVGGAALISAYPDDPNLGPIALICVLFIVLAFISILPRQE